MHKIFTILQYEFFSDIRRFQDSTSFLSFFVNPSELKEGIIPSFAFITNMEQIPSIAYPSFICLVKMQRLKIDFKHHSAVFFTDKA